MQPEQPSFWLIPGERLTQIQKIMKAVHGQSAHMTDEEIDAAIDEALSEVRQERHHLSANQPSDSKSPPRYPAHGDETAR
jgi:hypothetical protein